jgi:glycine oxidase
MNQLHTPDIVIAGAGIIGLSLALELRQRGLSVVVLEQGHAMRGSSWAAGGMLAVQDPENPPALLPLSLLSRKLYPEYLERIQELSGQAVPVRTHRTLQQVPHHSDGSRLASAAVLEEIRAEIPGFLPADLNQRFIWLREESIHPRDLCQALPRAVTAAGCALLEEMPVLHVKRVSNGLEIQTPRGKFHTGIFVNCCGAWSGDPRLSGLPVAPVKGQAVTVELAPERLACVLRTLEWYAIPRGDGQVTIGATVEHAGFDTAVEPRRIAELLESHVAALLPEIQSARILETWAGLRPGTPDDLPILSEGRTNGCWIASGHYRNGILLAPATARVMAQLVHGESTDVAIENFSAARFASERIAADAESLANSREK